MKRPPTNLLLACGTAALPWPALKLLEQSSQGCGDGLCGFLPGLAILAVLAVMTGVFLVRSGRRNESPAALRLIPLLLWLGPLIPLLW
jgi:hypothetical protein